MDVTTGSGILLNAVAGNWGTEGSNGGTAILAADGQSLADDLVAGTISSITATRQNGSSLSGSISDCLPVADDRFPPVVRTYATRVRPSFDLRPGPERETT